MKRSVFGGLSNSGSQETARAETALHLSWARIAPPIALGAHQREGDVAAHRKVAVGIAEAQWVRGIEIGGKIAPPMTCSASRTPCSANLLGCFRSAL